MEGYEKKKKKDGKTEFDAVKADYIVRHVTSGIPSHFSSYWYLEWDNSGKFL